MGPHAGRAGGGCGGAWGRERLISEARVFDGAMRHVPRFHHGLKIPTPSSRWGLICAPFQGALFYLAQSGPKGGRPSGRDVR